MPTFAFPVTPAMLTHHLLRYWNALLPMQSSMNTVYSHSFGAVLDARLLSVPRPLDQ